jgi:DNA polymerase-3 subunit epsilon
MSPEKPNMIRFPPPRSATRGKLTIETDCFVALDFETADYGQDSACSIALIRVENHAIVHREHRLIRTPRQSFTFSYLHGITWEQVAREPAFAELWPQIMPLLEGARFIAAHNASFDANVMRACCAAAALAPPEHPYLCTVKLARRTWNLRPTKLNDVCRHLGLSLKHHDALSDAEACANIVLAAIRDGALQA